MNCVIEVFKNLELVEFNGSFEISESDEYFNRVVLKPTNDMSNPARMAFCLRSKTDEGSHYEWLEINEAGNGVWTIESERSGRDCDGSYSSGFEGESTGEFDKNGLTKFS